MDLPHLKTFLKIYTYLYVDSTTETRKGGAEMRKGIDKLRLCL